MKITAREEKPHAKRRTVASSGEGELMVYRRASLHGATYEIEVCGDDETVTVVLTEEEAARVVTSLFDRIKGS
jgi:hypothetical protein